MRKLIAVTIAMGAVVLAAARRYRDSESWFWTIELVGAVWLFTGIWFGKVNLGRSHKELVKDELRGAHQWAPLTRVLIWGSCWLDVLAIVMNFVAT